MKATQIALVGSVPIAYNPNPVHSCYKQTSHVYLLLDFANAISRACEWDLYVMGICLPVIRRYLRIKHAIQCSDFSDSKEIIRIDKYF